MTIKKTLFWASEKLKNKKIKTSYLDAEVLLSYLLKKDKEFLYTYPNKKLTTKQLITFRALIAKRINLEPVAYLTGKKSFFANYFYVNKNVLIPRPETEQIVEEILKHKTGGKKSITIIDVGTGSGCIIIAIAKSIKSRIKNQESRFFAIDNSQKSMAVAHQNARFHGVGKKIKFIKGNLLEPLIKNSKLKIKNSLIIIANLPYLTTRQYRQNKELHFEPKSALVGGKDGLKYVKLFLKQLADLKPKDKTNITAYLEIDPAQTKKIKKITKIYLPKSLIQIKKDLCGRDRIIIIKS